MVASLIKECAINSKNLLYLLFKNPVTGAGLYNNNEQDIIVLHDQRGPNYGDLDFMSFSNFYKICYDLDPERD